MASVMGICGGMVGPKSENVEKVLVFKAFFEGSRAPRARQDREQPSGPGRFEVQKVMFLIKNAFCLYLELCFLQQRGVHFQKIHEKSWSESEKWSRKSLDGKCDGYMWGLGGAKKWKCWLFTGFNNVF